MPFLELIGCLWWLAQMTRPDIFVALQQASKWVARPSAKLWRWLTRIVRYLSGTINMGLVYRRNPEAPALKAFVDAAYADTDGCKSTAGWVYMFQGAMTAYDSITIKRIVTSSTEAECNALTIVGKENTWQRRIYQGLTGVDHLVPTPVYGDNSASLTMIGLGVTKRSRHYDIEWFKMHDLIEQKELTVQWIPTEENLADFFTKKLPCRRFELLRNQLMGGPTDQAHFDESTLANMLRVPSDWEMIDYSLPIWECLNEDAMLGGETDPWSGQPENVPVLAQVMTEKVLTPADIEKLYLKVNFDEVEEATSGKHKSVRASRIRDCKESIKEFTMRFISTIDVLLRKNPNHNFVIAQGEDNHLALACGWLYTKYAQAIHVPIQDADVPQN